MPAIYILDNQFSVTVLIKIIIFQKVFNRHCGDATEWHARDPTA